MDKSKFEEGRILLEHIDDLNRLIEKIDETYAIYYKTPDMDGGYTPGRLVEFSDRDRAEIKKALKAFFQDEIEKLEKQFEEL